VDREGQSRRGLSGLLARSHRTVLAPMEGVTHATFRALMASRGGVGMVCTEFVRVSRAPLAISTLRREVVKAEGVPLSVQVMGNEADKMAEAAAVVAEAGADVVDVNMGCPMPRVVRKGVGAAMLKDRALTFDVLSRMRKATPVLLSAKIRAGFDDADQVVAIAKVVEEAGADFIAVHPRRRCDYYDGVADWRIISVLKRELSIPVIGNGDVWYAADALRMERETACDAVMIGRPALRNPWIFQQIAALRAGEAPPRPSGADLFTYIDDVRRLYVRELGLSAHGVTGRLKELCRYCLRAVDGPDDLARGLLRAADSDAMMRMLEGILLPLRAEQVDLGAEGSLGLERSGSAALVDAEAVDAA
jgi:tRNA-dihydrouridine synthase B